MLVMQGVFAGARLAVTLLPPPHVSALTEGRGHGALCPRTTGGPILIASSHLPAWPNEGAKGGWAWARAVLNDPPEA